MGRGGAGAGRCMGATPTGAASLALVAFLPFPSATPSQHAPMRASMHCMHASLATHHLHRAARAHRPRQALCAAHAWDDTKRDLGLRRGWLGGAAGGRVGGRTGRQGRGARGRVGSQRTKRAQAWRRPAGSHLLHTALQHKQARARPNSMHARTGMCTQIRTQPQRCLPARTTLCLLPG